MALSLALRPWILCLGAGAYWGPWVLRGPLGHGYCLGPFATDPVSPRRPRILSWLVGHGSCPGPVALDPVLARRPWILSWPIGLGSPGSQAMNPPSPIGYGSGFDLSVNGPALAHRPWILLGSSPMDPVLARRTWILCWPVGHGSCLGPPAMYPVLARRLWAPSWPSGRSWFGPSAMGPDVEDILKTPR